MLHRLRGSCREATEGAFGRICDAPRGLSRAFRYLRIQAVVKNGVLCEVSYTTPFTSRR